MKSADRRMRPESGRYSAVAALTSRGAVQRFGKHT